MNSTTGAWRTGTCGAVTATTSATTITAHETPDTKGDYTQICAASDFDANGITVFISRTTGGESFLIDIAIGAPGSEQVILPDLMAFGQARGMNAAYAVFFPIRIPAGTRLAARCQGSDGAGQIRVMALLHGGAARPNGFSRVAAHGAVLTDMTIIDPGGTANTPGAWVQIASSTQFHYSGIVLTFGNIMNATAMACNWMVSVAIGAPGSEQVILKDYLVACETTYGFVTQPWSGFIPLSIPAGSRIAMRAQCSIADEWIRLLGTMIYGIG